MKKPFNPVINPELAKELMKVAKPNNVNRGLVKGMLNPHNNQIVPVEEECRAFYIEPVKDDINMSELLSEVNGKLNALQQDINYIKHNNWKKKHLLQSLREFLDVLKEQEDTFNHVVDEALIKLEKAIRIAEDK